MGVTVICQHDSEPPKNRLLQTALVGVSFGSSSASGRKPWCLLPKPRRQSNPP